MLGCQVERGANLPLALRRVLLPTRPPEGVSLAMERVGNAPSLSLYGENRQRMGHEYTNGERSPDSLAIASRRIPPGPSQPEAEPNSDQRSL